MTEEEAKKKHCPMAISAMSNGSMGHNRTKHGWQSDCNCIASDCMMWVWEELWDTEQDKIDCVVKYGHCGLIKS